ncbi:MFS transporter [Marinobacter daqiaonensis]|nr:MFS transporter [Marinobacter daqiaonensis]
MDAWGPVLTMGLLQAALTTSLPWLIETSGLSAGYWAVIMAAGMVPVMAGAPVWGRFVERNGSYWVLRHTMALVLTGYFLLLGAILWAPSAGWLIGIALLARLFHGVGAGGVFPAAQTLALSGAVPAQWSFRLARLQAATHSGRLLGPVGMAAAALVTVLGGLVAMGLVGLALSALHLLPQGSGRTASGRTPGLSPEIPLWREAWPVYTLALVLTAFVGVLQFVLGPWIRHILGIGADQATALTGLVLATASVSGVVSGLVVHRWVSGIVPLSALWFCLLLGGGLGLATAASPAGILAGVVLFSAGVAVLTPWYGMVLRARWPQAHGLVAGRLTSIHTWGYAVGTLAGGGLLEWRPENATTVLPLLAPVLLALIPFVWRRGLLEPARLRPGEAGQEKVARQPS